MVALPLTSNLQRGHTEMIWQTKKCLLDIALSFVIWVTNNNTLYKRAGVPVQYQTNSYMYFIFTRTMSVININYFCMYHCCYLAWRGGLHLLSLLWRQSQARCQVRGAVKRGNFGFCATQIGGVGGLGPDHKFWSKTYYFFCFLLFDSEAIKTFSIEIEQGFSKVEKKKENTPRKKVRNQEFDKENKF